VKNAGSIYGLCLPFWCVVSKVRLDLDFHSVDVNKVMYCSHNTRRTLLQYRMWANLPIITVKHNAERNYITLEQVGSRRRRDFLHVWRLVHLKGLNMRAMQVCCLTVCENTRLLVTCKNWICLYGKITFHKYLHKQPLLFSKKLLIFCGKLLFMQKHSST